MLARHPRAPTEAAPPPVPSPRTATSASRSQSRSVAPRAGPRPSVSAPADRVKCPPAPAVPQHAGPGPGDACGWRWLSASWYACLGISREDMGYRERLVHHSLPFNLSVALGGPGPGPSAAHPARPPHPSRDQAPYSTKRKLPRWIRLWWLIRATGVATNHRRSRIHRGNGAPVTGGTGGTVTVTVRTSPGGAGQPPRTSPDAPPGSPRLHAPSPERANAQGQARIPG